ncbi:Asp-tRNA(Asn)/Glu-tRNA(Gln) amidotransferase A subunit family amidase [Curtobacterium flaccumfaciens]|uniref:Asp-tRNA(Asn)/Glu-tRNA(Gln) amidotransferase A subunit family amidase n=1 Tax=Curtobacterium salicis TaxID=1779862 RepID=A0ABX0TDP9_9MICO|nr:Asp-tRNA(Asn)/Glu-tRNA(Gln) amidotransferase A subunit family amidase [Curtobacterium sp. WW7]
MRLTGTWPAGLESAFHRYEDALVRDDTAVLDALFEPGPGTLRGDGAGLLRGHEQISAFRSARGGVAPRVLVDVDVQVLGPDAAVVVGISRFVDGGRGLQTQLWCRTDGTWRIRTAHVTGRATAFDRSVWRVLGDPLVPGAGAGSAPLAGVRVAVKDLLAVRGQVIGAGNPTWQAAAAVEDEHAPAVAVLLDAGAAVVGIARTDEFAYALAGRNAHSGTTPNGAAPERIGGGSTSGPASAVALGQADLGLGTDTAGSIRVPASYQGLWGLRTTHGAVPRDGVLPLAQTFDTVGWLTRGPELLRRVVEVTLGEAGTTPTGIDTAALLLSETLLDAAEPDTRRAFVDWTERTGRALHPVALPDLDELAETVRIVQAAEAHRNHGAWIAAHPEALGSDVAERFAAAAAVTVDQEAVARVRLVELRTALRRAVGNGVLALPTVPGPAPSRTADTAAVLVTRRATLRMTAVAGIGGLPAISIPALEIADAPVGVSLVGPVGADRALVDLATDLTAATRL